MMGRAGVPETPGQQLPRQALSLSSHLLPKQQPQSIIPESSLNCVVRTELRGFRRDIYNMGKASLPAQMSRGEASRP